MALSLIYHAGALGDYLTTLPAMEAWRRLHGADQVVLLGKGRHAGLAPSGLFDEVWEAESSRFSPLFSGNLDAASALDARIRAFQSALLFCSPSSGLPASLERLGVREIVRQEPFPVERVHVVDYHLSLFPGLLFAPEDHRPRVLPGADVLGVPPGTAALHPGSGNPKKNWPFERFCNLAENLERAGLAVRWVLGPAEEGMKLPSGAEAWRNARLSDLAAAFAACRLFVGNDSGVTHLAAAAGCPTVALFGATDPGVWAPRGRLVSVVEGAGRTLEALDEETVLSACLDVARR